METKEKPQSPSPTLPKGREKATTNPSPVSSKRETGEGCFCGQHRSPIPAFPKGKEPFKPPKTQQVGTPATWGGMGRGTYGLPPLGEGWGGAPMDSRPLGRAGEGPPVSSGNSVGVAFSQPRVEGRSTSTLGKDIKRDSNAVSIAISRRRYHNAIPSLPISRGIIQLSITPTAKRNSYRVAILVGALPRVAGHARNPGLCNRNSVRVAWGAHQPIEVPSQPSPRGRSATQTPSNTTSRDSRPLGRAGEGLPAAAGMTLAGSYHTIRELVTFDTCARFVRYVAT